MTRLFYLSCLFFLLAQFLAAQSTGVRGYVQSTDGTRLEFSTILVRETGSGAVANAEGFYEINLPPGAYTLVFQYLGYETYTEQVRVAEGFTVLDVRLNERALSLQEVEVIAGGEDPAYTVMRRAIAKASYHRQQVDTYQARVYLKGSGRLKESPFFARRALAKEGIDSTVSFVSESVSIIEYERPNTFKETVISIYEQGEDNDSSPNNYIRGSFYQPEIGDAISPLSPKAFAYYRFRHDGFFVDRGYGINKIAVIPRSRGDRVFEGHIFIIQDLWSIHSLDLATYQLGIRFNLNQIYAPVREDVWLPRTARIEVDGKILGFGFEYLYLANLDQYEITLNPDLPNDFVIIDEQLDKEKAKAVEAENRSEAAALEERLSDGEELTRKELRKLMREYEREERKEEPEPAVVEEYEFTVDSTARERDSTYWQAIRPIPLTPTEVRGYAREDSIAKAELEEQAARESGDTSAVRKRRGSSFFNTLAFGESYKLGSGLYLDFEGLLRRPVFTPVEGIGLASGLRLRTTGDRRAFSIGFVPRYGFAWDRLNWKTVMNYRTGPEERRSVFSLQGGRFLTQFNREEAINPTINTIWALLFERSFIRLYERDFVQGAFRHNWHRTANFTMKATWANRRTVMNASDFTIFDRDDRIYDANFPVNVELDTLLNRERAFFVEAAIETRPWQKYRLRNKERIPISNSSPVLTLRFRRGFPDIGESISDYDLVDFTYRHKFDIGARGTVDLKLNAGLFLSDTYVGFSDYKHFPGGEVLLTTNDPVGSFRLLPYYELSTRQEYAAGFAHYQFRKFLLSRIWEVQLLGIKENIFANYLYTPVSDNYFELGYSIDNILRFLRLEFVTSFQDGTYRDFGIRLGIASNIGGGFVDVEVD